MKRVMTIVAVLAFMISCTSGLLAYSLSDTNYEVFQTFDTATEQNGVELHPATYGPCTFAFADGAETLAGKSSLKLSFGSVGSSGLVTVSVNKDTPAPTINNPAGIFFRLKANNLQDASIRVTVSPDDNIAWNTNAAYTVDDAKTVDLSGNVVQGKYAANFDGYVFLPINASNNNAPVMETLKAGGATLSLMFYGANAGGSWSDVTAYIDSVGYYSSQSGNEGYASIASSVTDEYPAIGGTGTNSGFEVKQTFDTAEEQARVAQHPYPYGQSCSISYADGADALSGVSTLKLSFGTMSDGGVSVVTMDNGFGAPGISNPAGIFLRLKANNADGASIRVTVSTGNDFHWNQDSAYTVFDGITVAADGTVATGKYPANFDGYVFLPIGAGNNNKPIMDALIAGTASLSLMFYDSNWSNTVAYIDNVGYYQAQVSNTAYSTLAAQIDAQYPGTNAGGDDEKQTYEIKQSFNTSEDQNRAGIHPYTYNNPCNLTFSSGAAVLSGANSLKLAFPSMTDGAVSIATMDNSFSAPTISNPGGVFFRLKANNPQGASIRVTVSADDTITWNTNSAYTVNDAVTVDMNGNVLTGTYPANFDGYVFLPIGDYPGNNNVAVMDALKAGNAKLSLMFYDSKWSNVTAYIDNVGYYVTPDSNAGYADIASDVTQKNPPVNNGGSEQQNTDFQVFQTFDTKGEQDRTEKHIRSTCDGLMTFPGQDDVLAGSNSLKLALGNIDSYGAYVLTLDKAVAAPTLEKVDGVFFRLKANNLENAFFRLTIITDNSDFNWGNDTLDMQGKGIFVKSDGTVIHAKDENSTKTTLPANFDGYVFFPIGSGAFMNALKAGTASLSVVMYGPPIDGEWANVTALFDSVGYYTAQVDDAGYTTLASNITKAYPITDDGGSSEPVKSFDVVQTFEETADQGKVGLHTYTYGNCNIVFTDSENALTGNSSLMLALGKIEGYGLVTVTLDDNITAPSVSNPAGIFFRLKATNRQDAFFRFSVMLSGQEPNWGVNTVDAQHNGIYVGMDGKLSTGDLPANFDGYVFLPITSSTVLSALKNGGVPLSILMYGDANAGSWSNVTAYIDNVGFYAPVANSEAYPSLATEIKKAYPQNVKEIVKMHFTYESAVLPSTEALVKYGIKSMITAHVHETIPDSTVDWSVVSGKAVITSLDEGSASEIASKRSHSCYVDFKQSGTVVVRATLKSDPTVYIDYSFEVVADATPLSMAVIKAKSISGNYPPKLLDNLNHQISLAESLLKVDVDYLDQAELDQMLDDLNAAMEALENPEAGGGSVDVDTGVPTSIVIPFVAVSCILLMVFVRKKRFSYKKG